MTDHKQISAADKRAEEKLGLLIHAGVALGVAVLVTVINLTTQTDYLWFKWPLLGLGLSLIGHALGLRLSRGGLKARLVRRELSRPARA